MEKAVSRLPDWLTRANVFRMYAAFQILIFLLVYGDRADAFVLIALSVLMLMRFKWAAIVVSGIFIPCFLIVEFLPRWDLNPQISTGQIRCAALLFLVPVAFTITCWNALR